MHMSPFLFVRDGNMNVNKERLCAFTDGIAAIAATIMVLNLGLPDTDDWSTRLSKRTRMFHGIILRALSTGG